ncbi:MAG: hypothetical protein COY47_06705 [Chloroflexi bacterium CG_4_10_14_0_8_um_filter_57_5]|nr:MAG: hypothetical protein COY47_06705 [Chloroflexi bacterium CG_4_10_14_0_8_um_filter_57_5]
MVQRLVLTQEELLSRQSQQQIKQQQQQQLPIFTFNVELYLSFLNSVNSNSTTISSQPSLEYLTQN